ncbi:MAG: transglutaminase-like domain-containing protein, partial [Cryobacterium sp.]
TRGQEYTVTALELQPTAQQLRESRGRYPVEVAPMLVLPFPRPDIIAETLNAVTQDATSKYDEALAIQDYLRGFRYDTEAPVEDGYDGGGMEVIGTFLEVKRGYCVHFASAMAVMARTMGIPARIAIGYLPGTRDTDSPEGSDRYNVDSHDLHSWPELYFVGVGWVPFEPTPGRGTVPDYALPPDAATPTDTPATTGPTQAPRDTDPGFTPDTGSVAAGTAGQQNADALLRVGLSLLLALVVLLTPGIVRAIRRTRRMRRLRSGQGGAEGAWIELTDCALDLGVPVRATETPRELAARLRQLPGLGAPLEASAALGRLLVAAERERYARPGAAQPQPGPDLAGDLVLVTRAIRAGAEPRARIIASLLPASLWAAIVGRGDGRTPQGA